MACTSTVGSCLTQGKMVVQVNHPREGEEVTVEGLEETVVREGVDMVVTAGVEGERMGGEGRRWRDGG